MESEEVNNGHIVPISVNEELKNSYLDYSMSVIVGRALPDARDGLKPCHRRILYAMKDLGLVHNRPYKKSARVVGEVLGKYHPHGDTAVYDALVRMVQDFSLRYPLIDGQGNFGSIDGDNAAAMRYTETRMQSIAEDLLEDIEKQTVDYKPNFDESLQEPIVLPSKIPNLLVNGSSGIAVGMATNIPPHNLCEIVDGMKMLIDNPESSIDDLMGVVKGPDFPTGATIHGVSEIRRMYRTGKGLIRMRAVMSVEEKDSTREQIIITEIPYVVNKATLLEKIADLVRDKKITGISDLRDESDRRGMRIVIELKRGEIAQVIQNQLLKHTSLERTFGATLVALDKGHPKLMNLKELMTLYLDHRSVVITRRTEYELRNAEARAHILEGFRIATDNIDKVVAIIKAAKSREDARNELMATFGLSERQAKAILEMRLYQLTGMEKEKIENEYNELLKKIQNYKDILGDIARVYAIVKEELDEVRNKYGDERRTEIMVDDSEIDIEDLIPNEPVIITVSHEGYIKRVPLDTYKQQKRGGKGVIGLDMKDEDFVEHLFMATAHDYILFFTNMGKVHWLKVYNIPSANRTSRGKAIVNMLQLEKDEKISSMLCLKDFTDTQSIVMATRKGIIKKTNLSAFSNPRKAGIIAINIDVDDELINVELVGAGSNIILVTRNGLSIRFAEDTIREIGRVARGVKGITLKDGDSVVDMAIVDEEHEGAALLVLCENGHGKRTKFDEYRVQNRGGKGIISIKTTERNGKVVGAKTIIGNEDIMMITTQGKMVRTGVEGISEVGRNTQGVRVIKLYEGDKLSSVIRIPKQEQLENADELEEGVALENAPAESGENAPENTDTENA